MSRSRQWHPRVRRLARCSDGWLEDKIHYPSGAAAREVDAKWLAASVALVSGYAKRVVSVDEYNDVCGEVSAGMAEAGRTWCSFTWAERVLMRLGVAVEPSTDVFPCEDLLAQARVDRAITRTLRRLRRGS